MKKQLTKEEFVKAVVELKDSMTMELECEEGTIETMQFLRVPFNGGATLFSWPLSGETGILQDDKLGSLEDNAGELFETLCEYFYYPCKEIRWNLYSLFGAFNEKYGGYVCIESDVCRQFIEEFPENLQTVDNLYDWVISQDKAEEVVL